MQRNIGGRSSSLPRAVARWLDDASDATPAEVIDAVLLAARSTPQERSSNPWRTSPMTYQRLAAVVAVVAVAGAGTLRLRQGAGRGGPDNLAAHDATDVDAADRLSRRARRAAGDVDSRHSRVGSTSSSRPRTSAKRATSRMAPTSGLSTLRSCSTSSSTRTARSWDRHRSRLPHDRTATEDEWLAFIAETRPDAAEWLTSERDAYLVAPGEEVTRAEWFGGLCAGLVTGSSVIEPASEATYLYMWLGYEQDCP